LRGAAPQDFTPFVNVFNGTDGTGHTFPGRACPAVWCNPATGDYVLSRPLVARAQLNLR